MRFLVCTLTFAMVLGIYIPAPAQDLTQFEKRVFIGVNGTELPYRILYPEGYDKQRPYPLVLFLHGSGERGMTTRNN